MSKYFKHTPAVFAVDKYYQIMMPCEKSCLFFVKVGDKFYYDESNGIMCSRNKIHKVDVPADELDKAKEYTVCIRPIINRKAYFSKTKRDLPFGRSLFNFLSIIMQNTTKERSFIVQLVHCKRPFYVLQWQTFAGIVTTL